MVDVCLRDATQRDLDRLVDMNLELIEDEAYDVPLPRDKVETRMRDFLNGELRVFLFGPSNSTDDHVFGYALIDLVRQPIYLRHFYICRNYRRQGIGRIAFHQVCEKLNVDNLDVEVMAWNEGACEFWRSLGFVHRYEGLRWNAD